MIQGKRRLSPSKSAWMTGDKVSTKYEKSCARYVLWERRYEKEVDIDPLYQAMGSIDEARYATKLKREGLSFEREAEITHPIGDTGITIEGRIDFTVYAAEGTVLIEKKSTISANRRRDIIDKGNVDPSHLAQLVSYMAVKKVHTGKIVVTFWQWDDSLDALVVGGEREFLVKVTPSGEISIDGLPYPAHVRHLQLWYHTVAKAMLKSDEVLPDRPKRGPSAWTDPCHKCPLANSCNKYDTDRNIRSFWEDTKAVMPSTGPVAEIIAPKLKKGKKDEYQIQSSSDTNHDSGRIQDKTGSRRDGWEVD